MSSPMALHCILGLVPGIATLTAIFVTMRLVVNVAKTKKLLVEDGMCIFALVFLMAASVLNCITITALFDSVTPTTKLLQLIVAFNFTVGFAMWSSKVPVMLLYVRLFGVSSWLRIASYTTIILTLLVFLSGMSVVGAICTPHGDDSTPQLLSSCAVRSNMVGFSLGFVALATDLVILVAPLPLLVNLSIPRHKKVGLLFIFMTGIIAIAAGAISSYYKWRSISGGTAWDMGIAMLCRVVECCIAHRNLSMRLRSCSSSTAKRVSAIWRRSSSCSLDPPKLSSDAKA
ncbi:hypothetical protein B0T25DRAFT_98360 [Lasiosphaeria hispida]|uniref:Rhodopsin domain-containing protein n=1 Tax=Lasiosphaeria hispida TaxID=260671 RepID=A0AAJ0HQC3_9PEZI|nr:hypothetical protein B0T25DRAFT_98360 [Lasiosphaeria hispida]